MRENSGMPGTRGPCGLQMMHLQRNPYKQLSKCGGGEGSDHPIIIGIKEEPAGESPRQQMTAVQLPVNQTFTSMSPVELREPTVFLKWFPSRYGFCVFSGTV